MKQTSLLFFLFFLYNTHSHKSSSLHFLMSLSLSVIPFLLSPPAPPTTTHRSCTKMQLESNLLHLHVKAPSAPFNSFSEPTLKERPKRCEEGVKKEKQRQAESLLLCESGWGRWRWGGPSPLSLHLSAAGRSFIVNA